MMHFKSCAFMLLCFCAGMLLCSCAAPPQEKGKSPSSAAASNEAAAETAEGPSRQALFVYQDRAAQKEIILTMNSAPTLLASGYYARLAGMAGGANPVALVEMAGRGIYAGIGEEIGEYRLVNILADRVILLKTKEGEK